tara:strand:- start:19 stop:228 length:210 start_codon:yes stop_codon:yes gene_type:complete
LYSKQAYQKKKAIYGRLNSIFQYCTAPEVASIAYSEYAKAVANKGLFKLLKVIYIAILVNFYNKATKYY